MTDLLWLFAGSSLVCGGVAYAWWSKLKPLFLREDLFIIRNKLWDVAFKNNGLDDAAYRQARAHLNALIRTASLFSILSLYSAVKATKGRTISSSRTKSGNVVLQAAIDKAYDESANSVVKYVMYRSAFGLFLVCNVVVTVIAQCSVVRGTSNLRAVKKWITSIGPDELSQMESAARHAKRACRA